MLALYVNRVTLDQLQGFEQIKAVTSYEQQFISSKDSKFNIISKYKVKENAC